MFDPMLYVQTIQNLTSLGTYKLSCSIYIHTRSISSTYIDNNVRNSRESGMNDSLPQRWVLMLGDARVDILKLDMNNQARIHS